MDNVWPIHTMEYYSKIKKKKKMNYWHVQQCGRYLKGIMLNEKTQTPKFTYYQFHLHIILKRAKLQWWKTNQSCQKLGTGKGYDSKGAAWKFLHGDTKVLYPDCGGSYTNLYVIKTSQNIYQKKRTYKNWCL